MTFGVLPLLRRLLDELFGSLSIGNLVREAPMVHFRSELAVCPKCSQRLKVKKTSNGRMGFTLHVGRLEIHETSFYCAACNDPRIYRSEELSRLFPERCNFGYDVIVHIGRRLFLDNLPVGAIKEELKLKNVDISESEIGFLARRFIHYLAIAHRQASSRLREAMDANGGYILHIDATCEGGGPMLVSGMDALTSTILWNEKIPTEKADYAANFLREISQMYGRPLLVVSDMSNGFEGAVREVFGTDMPTLICHFHFLRDIGKDLLEKEYDTLRRRLRTLGIAKRLRYRLRYLRPILEENQELLAKLDPKCVSSGGLSDSEMAIMPTLAAYSIIQWTLEGKNIGDAYGFPFDRPLVAFAERINEAAIRIEELKQIFARNNPKENRPIFKSANDLKNAVRDKALKQDLESLKRKAKVFDDLRKAMRIAPPGKNAGLNDNGGDESIDKIEARVGKFRKSLLGNQPLKQNEYKKMIEQIDKYWERLFADPITVNTPEGIISVQPQRTNNIMEQFFRDVRRAHRRQTGNNSMGARIRAMEANSLLARNLNNRQYMHILLNGRKSLEEVFADIELKEVMEENARNPDSVERIPPKIKKLIKSKNFPEEMVKSLRNMVN